MRRSSDPGPVRALRRRLVPFVLSDPFNDAEQDWKRRALPGACDCLTQLLRVGEQTVTRTLGQHVEWIERGVAAADR
jgi:hypothetical protein